MTLEPQPYVQRCAFCTNPAQSGSPVCAEHRSGEDKLLRGYGVYAKRMEAEDQARIDARQRVIDDEFARTAAIERGETERRELAQRLEEERQRNDDLGDMLANLIEERGVRR